MKQAAETTRNAGIDCLRGLSMLIVLLLHFSLELPHDFAPLGEEVSRRLFENGYYGVASFFVISGFLITTNTLRRYGRLSRISLREFYIMRASRILPLLFAFLTLLSVLGYTGVVGFAEQPKHPIPEMLWYAVTFRFNIYFTDHQGWEVFPWALLWSLSIEEVFYLAFPILCKFARPPFLAVPIFGAILVYGPYFLTIGGNSWNYFSCFDLMALGVLTALAADTGYGRRLSAAFGKPLAVIGIATILYSHQDLRLQDHSILGPLLVGLGAALVLLACRQEHVGTVPRWLLWLSAPLRAIGRYSYECYLLHSTILVVLQTQFYEFGDQPYLYLAMTLVAVTVCGAVTGLCFAEPTNRRLRRWLTGRLPSGSRVDAAFRSAVSRS